MARLKNSPTEDFTVETTVSFVIYKIGFGDDKSGRQIHARFFQFVYDLDFVPKKLILRSQRAVHDKSYLALASVLGSSYATYKKTYGIKQHLAPEIVNFGIKCRSIEWHFGIENLKIEVKMLWH